MTRFQLIVISVLLIALSTAAHGVQAPVQSPFEGLWVGTLRVGVKDLRIAIDVTMTSGEPKLTVTLVDQGGAEKSGSNIRINGTTLRFEVSAIRSAFEGTLDVCSKRIAGTWRQGAVEYPLTFARADRSAVIRRRPQDPLPPLPYDEIAVMVPHEAAGLTLAGTLTVPRTAGPHPAALLISGSGPQDRNEEIFGHRPFLVLADDLTRRGIAVLRVDDRGVGGSSGKRDQATVEDYAGDALAAVRFLESRPEVDPRRIGLIGHSEGGLVAPLVAAKFPSIAFVALLAAPGLPGAEISVMQARTMLRAAGAPPEAIETQTRIQKRVLTVLGEISDEAAIRSQIREILREELIRAGDAQASQLALVERQLEPQIRRALTPWSRFFMVYDPRPALTCLKCPVLALNGTMDAQVPAVENLAAIEAALRSGGNPDVTVMPLEGLNHLFQTSSTGAVSEYATIDETFSPLALENLGAWIVKRMIVSR